MQRTGLDIDRRHGREDEETLAPSTPSSLKRQPSTARDRSSSVKGPAKTAAPAPRANRTGKGPTPARASGRRFVFISHANPEDNPAASWFATQLTLLGYDVWCDLKSTHGGESDFWLKVQKTIENDAAKFVYILSNTSCDF
jgi:hypothetical protein